MFTAAVALNYCRLAVTVERSYDYLHFLEDRLSPMLGGEGIYRREGEFYLNKYPPLLNLSWMAYGYFFPVVIAVATVGLLVNEWCGLEYPVVHKTFDTAMGAGILLALIFYRAVPTAMRQWDRWRRWNHDHKNKGV